MRFRRYITGMRSITERRLTLPQEVVASAQAHASGRLARFLGEPRPRSDDAVGLAIGLVAWDRCIGRRRSVELRDVCGYLGLCFVPEETGIN